VELIENSVFTRQITALLSDEEYAGFQSRIAANPAMGALIGGGGGLRNVRVAVGSRGKSGGGFNTEAGSRLARVVKEEFGSQRTDV